MSSDIRYNPFSRFLGQTFGRPVYKIPLDAGLTCPNRDGRIGRGGCAFCYNPSFAPSSGLGLSIPEQIRRGKERIRRRHPKAVFMAYFQSHTNTYAPLHTLQELYNSAVNDPDVVGLSIATRPDCVSDQVLGLIESYTDKYHVWLEYGLQTIHNRTLALINRGHTAQDFFDAVRRTQGRGIFTCAHVIIGLPGETRGDVLATARALAGLGLNGVKIHHLQVIRHTALAASYQKGELPTLTLAEYVPLVCDFLECLDPQMIIHRLCGEVLQSELLLAPHWDTGKAAVLSAINQELATRGTRQGSRFPAAILCW